MSMAWIYLLIAAGFEVGFTTALSLTAQGKQWAWGVFLLCAMLSFHFLSLAIKTIPIGMAYAIWTGIGAVGTLLVSALVFKAALTPVQYGLVALLIASIIGLKLASPAAG